MKLAEPNELIWALQLNHILEEKDVKDTRHEEKIDEHFIQNFKSEINPINALVVKVWKSVIFSNVVVKLWLPVVLMALEDKVLEADFLVVWGDQV